MAQNSRSAEYFVNVRYPLHPLAVGNMSIVRAEPTVPVLKESDREQPFNRGPNREYSREIADMVAEPKQ
jgi:hypothetical protein